MPKPKVPYFSHDADERSKPQVMALMNKYGWKGYGIYWGLKELLRISPDYEYPTNYKDLKKYLKISSENILKSIIEDFGLFEKKDGIFWSEDLKRRMLYMEYKSKKAAASVYNRYNKSKANTISSVADVLKLQFGS